MSDNIDMISLYEEKDGETKEYLGEILFQGVKRQTLLSGLLETYNKLRVIPSIGNMVYVFIIGDVNG